MVLLIKKEKLPFAEQLVDGNQEEEEEGLSLPVNTEKLVSQKKQIKEKQKLLKDALKDLEDEVRVLRAAKKELEREMSTTSEELGMTQREEIKLRNKISELMKSETILDKKKSTHKEKLEELNKKIEKITAIERQLKEV